jgi:integrase
MSEKYQKLAECIAIYKPNKNCRVWWLRARIDKKEIRTSTKQRDKNDAIKTAWAMFSNFENRIDRGLMVIPSKTIKSLKIEILEKIDKKGSRFDQTKIFNDVILKEWGNISAENLTSKDVENLYKKYNVSGTAKENYYKMTLKTIFDYLALNKIVNRGFLPELPKVTKREKESFDILTASELKATLKHFEDLTLFFEEEFYKNETVKNLRKLEIHRITNIYLRTLAHSGARAGLELLNLKVSDIEIITNRTVKTNIYNVRRLNINIKNGKMSKRTGSRKIPAWLGFEMDIVNLLKDIHNKNFYEMKKNKEDMFIFSQPHKPEKHAFVEKTVRENFKILKENGSINSNKKIAPYSFRHAFITHALCQKVDIFLLSELVGNSVSEIQKTYSRFSAVHRDMEVYEIDIFNNNIDVSS